MKLAIAVLLAAVLLLGCTQGGASAPEGEKLVDGQKPPDSQEADAFKEIDAFSSLDVGVEEIDPGPEFLLNESGLQ